jgi:hypothetical protein
MIELIVGDIFNLLLKAAAVALLARAGSRWGMFAVREAVRLRSARWKAYLLGLLAPVTAGYVVFCEPHLSSSAYAVASVASAGSVFGVLVNYPRSAA